MEDEHGAEDGSIGVDNGDGVGIDGDTITATSADAQSSEGLDTGGNGVDDGAILVGDGRSLFAMDVEEAWRPLSVAYAGAGDPGHSFCAVIPSEDAHGGVDEDNGIVHVVEEAILKEPHVVAVLGLDGAIGECPVGVGDLGGECVEPSASDFFSDAVEVSGVEFDETVDEFGIELCTGAGKELESGAFQGQAGR